jgi:hypothetical protein
MTVFGAARRLTVKVRAPGAGITAPSVCDRLTKYTAPAGKITAVSANYSRSTCLPSGRLPVAVRPLSSLSVRSSSEGSAAARRVWRAARCAPRRRAKQETSSMITVCTSNAIDQRAHHRREPGMAAIIAVIVSRRENHEHFCGTSPGRVPHRGPAESSSRQLGLVGS